MKLKQGFLLQVTFTFSREIHAQGQFCITPVVHNDPEKNLLNHKKTLSSPRIWEDWLFILFWWWLQHHKWRKTGICSLGRILIEVNIHFKEKEERLWGKINFLGLKNSKKDKRRAFEICRVSVSLTLPPKCTRVSLLFFPSPPSQVNMTSNIIWVFIQSIIHTMFPRAAGIGQSPAGHLLSRAGLSRVSTHRHMCSGHPSNQDSRKRPWVTAEEVWFGYQGKILHGKGCQTLEQAAWGSDGVPSGTWGHGWQGGLAVLWGMVDSMSLEGFSNLKDSMAVSMTFPNPQTRCWRMCLQAPRAHPSLARKEISLLAQTLEHFKWGEEPPGSNPPRPGLSFVLCPLPSAGASCRSNSHLYE